jgi:antitoxin component of RelBE/YafQ-DinJ toxin-antitoxin module
MSRPTNRPINFRLSDKLRERLTAEAERRGIGPGELVRLLIAQSCQSAEEENSKTTKDRERTYAK